ncbi:MAG: response regulator [Peptostreptococcaceae bacterium]|jgi:CheY-like chemotaxis protein|nr:response regulator [Peptostreptococcaceae bacterium]
MNKNKKIMLIEDDYVDALTIKRAFRDIKVENELIIAEDGEKALEMLKTMEEYPQVIILDLNMPKLSGVEFLKIIKKDDDLSIIPVVIMTTSKEDEDKLNCYKNGISGYIEKPIDYNEFLEILKIVYDYWMINEFPR